MLFSLLEHATPLQVKVFQCRPRNINIQNDSFLKDNVYKYLRFKAFTDKELSTFLCSLLVKQI